MRFVFSDAIVAFAAHDAQSVSIWQRRVTLPRFAAGEGWPSVAIMTLRAFERKRVAFFSGEISHLLLFDGVLRLKRLTLQSVLSVCECELEPTFESLSRFDG